MSSANKSHLTQVFDFQGILVLLVPLAGIEPALLAEPDFESGASTNSAKGAAKKASAMSELKRRESQIHAEGAFGQQQ